MTNLRQKPSLAALSCAPVQVQVQMYDGTHLFATHGHTCLHSFLTLLRLTPPPANRADTTQTLRPPAPACNPRSSNNNVPLPRWSASVLLHNASITLSCRTERRCNRTGRLTAAIIAFASRTLGEMMKRKQNAFELTQPLQDVWENCETAKIGFRYTFFFSSSSLGFNLPSRVNPCNLQ